jgi:hypothetical protein
MNRDHPCYEHRESCDWRRICRRDECCDRDKDLDGAPAKLEVPVGQ